MVTITEQPRGGCSPTIWLFLKIHPYLSIPTLEHFYSPGRLFHIACFWPWLPSCRFQKETPRCFRRSPGHQDLSSRLLSETVGCCWVLFCMWSFSSPNKGPLLQWRMLRPSQCLLSERADYPTPFIKVSLLWQALINILPETPHLAAAPLGNTPLT